MHPNYIAQIGYISFLSYYCLLFSLFSVGIISNLQQVVNDVTRVEEDQMLTNVDSHDEDELADSFSLLSVSTNTLILRFTTLPVVFLL